MIFRTLGRTGIRVSAVSFGAGPVSGLMTGEDREKQLATVARAIEIGINWFDTAAGYGEGRSESNLGRVLAELGAGDVHIATKVRLPADSTRNIGDVIRESVSGSLERLARPRVTLLQLHNGVTFERETEPSSITPAEVLGPVADAFRGLQDKGLVQYLGLTGTGEHGALRKVVQSGLFDTLQVPFNILNPSAGGFSRSADGGTNHGNIIADCAAAEMGVFAIRVFAGGALLGQPPSAHTLRTPFFPLALYESDARRAGRFFERLGRQFSATDVALRFALSHPSISSAIVGFGSPAHVDQAASCRIDLPLSLDLGVSSPTDSSDTRN